MKRFQKGDRVFDIRWGWGEIVNIEEDRVYIVKFPNRDNGVWYVPDVANKILSYTEYTLDGQSLERPDPSRVDIYQEWSDYDSDLKYREYLNDNFEPPVRKCK